MGKRVPASTTATAATDYGHNVTPTTRTIRKRKRGGAAKSLRLSSVAIAAATMAAASSKWHENDDEDSSSNDTLPATSTPARNHQASSKHANHSSILLNASFNTSALTALGDTSVNESPKPVYTLRPSVVNGTILYDLAQKPWRLGRPIGKGNFGEIFLASDNITIPVTNENAKFVVKIEPHSNGPLFVEIHCLINTAKNNPNSNNDKIKTEKESRENKKPLSTPPPQQQEQTPRPSGIPDYIASGSHYFGDARYRFLVLQRFDRDLHSLIKNCRVNQKSVLKLAIQIVNVLERLHNKGYCHNDVKAQNLMISKCKYHKQKTIATTNAKSSTNLATTAEVKEKHQQKTHEYEEKQQTTDSGNSSDQEENNDNDNDEDYAMPMKKTSSEEDDNDDDDDDDDDEDFDDGETTNSNNSNSMDLYKTPVKKRNRKRDHGSAAASGANAGGRRCAVALRAAAPAVEYSGSNPVRSCRRQRRNSIYEEMVNSHYLRPTKRISYSEFFNEDGISIKAGGRDLGNNSVLIISSDDDDSEEFVPTSARRNRRTTRKSAVAVAASSSSNSSRAAAKRLTRHQEKLLASTAVKQPQTKQPNRVVPACVNAVHTPAEWIEMEEERIFLIDFGLASKFMDNGVHRPFFMDQRRAHDGTLEFTSRDAHTGAHSRRSDLECLGYNLLFWSQGYLPWKEAATHQQQEKVHRAKEYLMTDVRELLQQIYGKQVPKYLGEFLHHVGQLAYHERPDYAHYRRLFESEFQQIVGGAEIATNEDVMRLDSREIMRTCVRVKEEIENNKHNDLLEMNNKRGCGEHNHIWSIMKNLAVVGAGTPFHERTLSNRVSPKNLRSMSDKKSTIKKKFSWAEILSQDPDQIARERAEKEFEREEESDVVQQPTVRRYEGKPTYAIMEIQQRLIASGRLLPVEQKKEDLAVLKEKDTDEMEQEEEDEETNECDEVVEEDNAEEADEDDEDDENVLEAKEAHEVSEQQDSEEEDVSEIESDATEQQQKANGRSRRPRQMRISETTTTTSKKSTASKTNSGAAGRGKRGGSRKRSGIATATETTTTVKSTRKRSSKTTAAAATATSTTKSSSVKRGSVMRKSGGGGAASTAGEIEHASIKYLANVGGEGGASEQHQKTPPRRRTRRCLIKTDKALKAQVVHEEQQNAMSEEEDDDDDVIMMESEGSNSNFSPDVHSLFNVWKKINNETIYFRGSKVAAKRHCKK